MGVVQAARVWWEQDGRIRTGQGLLRQAPQFLPQIPAFPTHLFHVLFLPLTASPWSLRDANLPTPLQHQIIPRLFFQLEKWEGCTRGVNEADPGEAPGGGRPH